MPTRIEVIVTDQTRSTQKNTGIMQICGIDAGGPFPLEAAVFIPNDKKPLSPGTYFTSNLKRKGNEVIVDLFLSSLFPAK